MIKQCRSCRSEKLVDILSLGDQYLSDFVDDDKKPNKYPLDLILCDNCKLLQLKQTAPSDELYTDHYGYRSGINRTMRDHLREIANKAQELIVPKNTDIIIDIGCNDGTLLKVYNNQTIKVGFDPVGKFSEEYRGTNIRFVNDFFNKESYEKVMGNNKASIITAISMFYDLDDPNKFVADLKDILAEKGIIIIQQNYVVGMLLQNAYDNIVHEHLEYYSLLSMENLLKNHGLEVFDIELNDLNGGSFRTYICHKGARKISDSVKILRQMESQMKLEDKDTYKNFANRITSLASDLRSLIEDLNKKGKTIYLYGASTRGNTLLQYSKLDNNLIKKAVERNSEKWGKKIASVGIPIISEEEARKEKPDYMLVLPWFFKDEFIQREFEYLEDGGKFIFPLSKIEIIEA